MKAIKVVFALLVVSVMLLSACAPAGPAATPEPEQVVVTKEVEKRWWSHKSLKWRKPLTAGFRRNPGGHHTGTCPPGCRQCELLWYQFNSAKRL